jgi:hypothetical protein
MFLFCSYKIVIFITLVQKNSEVFELKIIELSSGCWETQLTKACQVLSPYLGQTGAVLRVPARNSGNP